MFGLGKKRSKLGRWLDNKGISQQWLAKTSKVSRSTVSDLCKGDSEHAPTQSTIKKIMNALRKIDPGVKADDFFDL
jgi:predicted transcriptional regulator